MGYPGSQIEIFQKVITEGELGIGESYMDGGVMQKKFNLQDLQTFIF